MPLPTDKQSSSHNRTRFLVTSAMLVALAVVFSYLEVLFPFSLAVPGVKLGLANVVVLFALCLLGWRSALVISLLRIVIVSSLFGNIMMAVYSIAGAAVSLLTMILLQRSGKFSLVGISMCGGVLHNVAQLSVAALVSGTAAVLTYLPVLIIAGMVSGVLIGWLSMLIVERLRGLQILPR